MLHINNPPQDHKFVKIDKSIMRTFIIVSRLHEQQNLHIYLVTMDRLLHAQLHVVKVVQSY